jgi:hypothetical protein
LGSSVLNDQTLSSYQSQLESIGKSLSDEGDILLYGCNVAEGEAGIDFVRSLAELTSADIAASDDTTGAAENGYDWKLEYTTGPINIDPLQPLNYTGTLATGTSPATTTLVLADTEHNGDSVADPLRMTTWNVIGLDSNKPAIEGPDTFMVGIRVETGNTAYTAADHLTVKIVDDDGIDIFGSKPMEAIHCPVPSRP